MLIPLWSEDDDNVALDRVAALLKAGNRIGAVLELREQTGTGFREAAQVVETLAEVLPPSPAWPDPPSGLCLFSAQVPAA